MPVLPTSCRTHQEPNCLEVRPFSLLLFLLGSITVHGSLSVGPLYDKFPLTLQAGSRTEVAGPLFHYEQQGAQSQWGLHPFFTYTQDPDVEMTEAEFLYPIMTYDRFGAEYRWQLLQWFNIAGGTDQEERESDRFNLIPFYFQQRSEDPDRNYTAVFPIYGTLKNRFFRDEVHWVLWPAYIQSRKRDVVTDNYLYPFFHLRKGRNLSGWQVWPITGHEVKEPYWRTNSWDEVERVAGHEKFFLVWPIFFHNNLGIGTDNPQKQRVFLPFYSLLRSPQRDSSTYLWPLFTYTHDREKKYKEWGAPWPLIVFARGEGKTANRVWPLFSKVENPSQKSAFALWPLYKFNQLSTESLIRKRHRVLFFLYSDLTEQDKETGDAFRRTDLWPLFTAREEMDGRRRLQLFAPIEPMLPGNKSIERNYSPLWSFWRSEFNPKTGALSQSLLWNLYRRDTTADSRSYSFLFGLFQYERSDEGRIWRLFFIPWGDGDESEQ